jgi:hypothetical protein
MHIGFTAPVPSGADINLSPTAVREGGRSKGKTG